MTAEQFANAATRERWMREKGATVLGFHSSAHKETPVDIFITEPFDFDEEYRRSVSKRFESFDVRVVSIETLIRMKESAGRAQDRIDVENLRIRLRDDDSGPKER